jgi:hypothetical protein
MSVRIERLYPRCPKGEQPYRRRDGRYELADPTVGPGWHKVENAVFADTLEDSADLIKSRGFFIRMLCPGKRPSLICPKHLRIT